MDYLLQASIQLIHRHIQAMLPLKPVAFQTPPTAQAMPTDGTPTPGALESTVNQAVDSVASRTPVPSPTPGFVQREVNQVTETLGWDDVTVLGLTAADWIDLGFSILLFLVAYWAALWFVRHVLRRLVQRTETQFDDQFFASIVQELKWLLGIILLRFSILRLTFLSGTVRTLLHDLLFILALLVVIRIAVKLIDFGLDWYEALLGSDKRTALDPAIVMLRNAGKLLVYVTGVSIGLSHFGLVSNAIVIVLLVVGVVALLSIRDIMTDIIYGFIILVGQPFRVGDAVQFENMEMDDWGWIAGIGSRETHIRTRDNRVLVVPNRQLGTGQVVNYMSPDPTYRQQTDLHFPYGTDFDRIRTLLEKTTREVNGVLPDKPVEVLHWQFGRLGRTVRVRWWIASCEEDNRMTTAVNSALEAALADAEIPIGFRTVDLQIDRQSDDPSPSTA